MDVETLCVLLVAVGGLIMYALGYVLAAKHRDQLYKGEWQSHKRMYTCRPKEVDE